MFKKSKLISLVVLFCLLAGQSGVFAAAVTGSNVTQGVPINNPTESVSEVTYDNSDQESPGTETINQDMLLESYTPGNDVMQSLPIYSLMEAITDLDCIKADLGSAGKATLDQDRISGNYSAKVAVGSYSGNFKLVSSGTFPISDYSQIKLWVKPGPGAKWVKFLTNGTLITSDANGDGEFEVGQDLTSGKWNEVTLDLTKMAEAETEGEDLVLQTNTNAVWYFDEITSIQSSTYSLDLNKMVNAQTQITNGALQFIPNGANTFDTTPTVLTSGGSGATFIRPSTAYKQDGTQVEVNAPRFETGKFRQGAMMEEGTTNLLTANQSSVETDLTGLEWFTDSGVTYTSVRDTSNAWHGVASAKMQKTNSTSGRISIKVTRAVTAGVSYSLSCYYKAQIANQNNVALVVDWNGTSGYISSVATSESVSGTTGWKRLSVSGVVPAGATTAYCYLFLDNPSLNDILWWDGAQLEQKPYATSWTLGGTTRAAESFTIPTAGVFQKGNWTVEMTFTPTSGFIPWSSLWSCFIDDNNSYSIARHADGRLYLEVKSNGIYYVSYSADSSVLKAGEQYTITACGDGSVLKFYINGIQYRGDVPYTEPLGSLPANMGIGYNTRWGAQANGIIDELRISSRARTLAEHQAAYNSNQPLPVDADTTYKLDFDGNLDAESYNDTNSMKGKINKIFVDSGYRTSSDSISFLPDKRMFVPGVLPTRIALSGDGNKLYYVNPVDGNKIYLLNLNTGVSQKIGDYVTHQVIKTDYDGSLVVFNDDIDDDFYYWDGTKKFISSDSSVIDVSVQNDGSICFYDSTQDKIILDGQTVYNSDRVSYLDIAAEKDIIFYTYDDNLYRLIHTPNGWIRNTLVDQADNKNINRVLTNDDGSLVVYELENGAYYCYQMAYKATRKLNLSQVDIIRITTDGKLIVKDINNDYQCYDLNTDETVNIRPSDAKVGGVFDVDSSGNKMVYVADDGIAAYYFNGAQRPERYLFSFDGKGSWYSCKDGAWAQVKNGTVPATEDFVQYGMTIDEVNSLTEADFASLYEGGREIYSFDVAVYFSSIDPYITPSLKGITLFTSQDLNDTNAALYGQALYAAKMQDFDAIDWRKVKKVYPVELAPKEAQMYYFVYGDNTYKSFKNGQWQAVDASLLNDLETNWINITLQGMTGEELRSMPQEVLTAYVNDLTSKEFSIVYGMKVFDQSTKDYSSQIYIDFLEDLFTGTNLTLRITLNDGTVKEPTGLTEAQVEDFMEWVNERQYNRGPIFYRIKTGNTNDFINYYMILSVTVEEQ